MVPTKHMEIKFIVISTGSLRKPPKINQLRTPQNRTRNILMLRSSTLLVRTALIIWGKRLALVKNPPTQPKRSVFRFIVGSIIPVQSLLAKRSSPISRSASLDAQVGVET